MENEKSCDGYSPIADYGIIGDCHTVALINKNGSMDWYCPERFDNPAVFCRLLDSSKGGYFQLCPAGNYNAERRYLPQTNILYTVFQSDSAQTCVTDFMPVYRMTQSRRGRDIGSHFQVLKKIEGISGDMEIIIYFKPTFDYARQKSTIEITYEGALASSAGNNALLCSIQGLKLYIIKTEQGAIVWRCSVKTGETGWIILAGGNDEQKLREKVESLTQDKCGQLLNNTREYWHDWAAQCRYNGPYQKQVLRSALTLKLLIYEPTGAVVAAPTTSLPEEIGGGRNWDYRFSWLRDSSLIIYALLNIGYKHEAADFFEWLQQIAQQNPKHGLKLLYNVEGNSMNSEEILDNLEGYQCSSPVRIGNAAGGQKQLDIYGELLNAAYLYFHSGIGKRSEDEAESSVQERLLKSDWPLLKQFVNAAAKRWKEEDNSIWEVRDQVKNYLYSKLMCWAALDRGIKLAEEFELDAPLDNWKETRQNIFDTIINEGYNSKLQAFVQAFGSSNLDASALIIPRLGFLSGTDERVKSTINLLQKELTNNGLVYRYRTSDGLPDSEYTFSLCSYWMVDALAFSGKIDEAHDLFEFLYSYANDLGLLSEEIDPVNRLLMGNFPQGFTHMALINSAVDMAKIIKNGPENYPEDETRSAVSAGSAVKDGYLR